MGCCGSKKVPMNTVPKKLAGSQVKVSGSNNIRLPAPLAPPYPNDAIDIEKYIGHHMQEGQVIQPGKEIVPHDLQDRAK